MFLKRLTGKLSGFENPDVIECQLDEFEKEMENAFRKGYEEITQMGAQKDVAGFDANPGPVPERAVENDDAEGMEQSQATDEDARDESRHKGLSADDIKDLLEEE